MITVGYFDASADFDPSPTGATSLTPAGELSGEVYAAKFDANLNSKFIGSSPLDKKRRSDPIRISIIEWHIWISII